MKCKHCGANISLEDEKCPFCGQPNEIAAGHARDMKRYQQEFTRTKDRVLGRMHQWGATTQQAMILGILIFLNLAVLLAKVASDDVGYWLQKMEVKIHEDAYYQQMADYEAEGEYGLLVNLSSRKGYMGDRMREFAGVEEAAYAYRSVKNMVSLLTDTHIKELYWTEEELVENLAEALEQFQQVWEKVEEVEEDPDSHYAPERYQGSHKAAITDMKAQIHMLLQAYCQLTPEDIEGLSQMSEQKKMIFIGTRLGIYEE